MGQIADPGQPQAGDPQGSVRLRHDLAARLGEGGGELLPLLGSVVRHPDPREVGRVGRDELGDAHVGHQLAAADHDQMVGGEGHLAHQVAGDEDRTALGRQHPHQIPDPEDALRVETVDRLVEEQHLRVAQQGGRDAQALPHAQREALGPPARDVLEADDAEHLVDAGGRDARELGEREQVVAGAAPAVHGLGVEQRSHLARCVRQTAEVVAADGHPAGRRPVQAENHPHRRRLARPVGAEEPGDGAGPHLEGKVVHGRLRAIALGQADCLDHAPAPSTYLSSGHRPSAARPPYE